jgi:hypothetical protein
MASGGGPRGHSPSLYSLFIGAASRILRLHHIWKLWWTGEGLDAQGLKGVLCTKGQAHCGSAVWLVKTHAPSVLPSSRSWSSLYSRWSSDGHLRMPLTMRFSSDTVLNSLASGKMVLWRRIVRNVSWDCGPVSASRHHPRTRLASPPPASIILFLNHHKLKLLGDFICASFRCSLSF